MNAKPILLGALTAVIFVLIIFILSMFVTADESAQYRTTNITIAGKICNDNILGSSVSKIQGDDGIIYFIPSSDCELYPVNTHGMIFYNHVCTLPVKEPGPLASYCYNRTVGDYP